MPRRVRAGVSCARSETREAVGEQFDVFPGEAPLNPAINSRRAFLRPRSGGIFTKFCLADDISCDWMYAAASVCPLAKPRATAASAVTAIILENAKYYNSG